MINVIKGDLIKLALAGDYGVIAHGCNCFNTMSSGIAYSIRKFFPEAYKADCNSELSHIDKLGSFTKMEYPELTVYNLYSQFTYNASIKPLDYEALALALRKMIYDLRERPVGKMGIPLIGFGLAGGKLERIIPILYNELKDFDVDIVIYDREKDVDSVFNRTKNLLDSLELKK